MVDRVPDGLEGFGPGARRALAIATTEARDLGSTRLGTEHLLLGLLGHAEGAAARMLSASGVTLAATRRKVGEAVGQREPDADRLPEPARAPAWPPHPPEEFERSARAERAIGRAFRFSHDGKAREVRTEHLLLGVLDVEGTAGQVLRGLGVDLERLRSSLEKRQDGEQNDGEDALDRVPATSVRSVSNTPANCARCAHPLEGALTFQVLTATNTADARRDVIVVSCATCGAAIGTAR